MHIHLIIYWCSRFIPSYMYLKLLKESDPPSLYCALLLLLWCGSIPYLGKHITSCTSEFLIYNTSNPELRNTAVSFVILDPLYHPIPWAPEVFLARFPVSVMSLLWPARKTSGAERYCFDSAEPIGCLVQILDEIDLNRLVIGTALSKQ